jgi:hypothetical protein
MPLEYDLINLFDDDSRIELIKILSARERDDLLRLANHTLLPLNLANIDKYINFPKTIPIVYRKKRKLEGLLVGIPIEKFSEDETFPDPDMGKRNTVYTAIVCHNDAKIYIKLLAEYRNYLALHNSVHESCHLKTSFIERTDFEVIKIFKGWVVDGVEIAYCKAKIGNGLAKLKKKLY